MAFNLGGGAVGTLGGAAAGATLGSIFPGIGTAIGAGIGAIGGGLAGAKTGKKGKFKQTPNKFSPQQQQVLQQLLLGGQQGLQNNTLQNMGMQRLQNPLGGFNDVEKYAKEQFHGSIVPSLAERFTSLGGAGTGQNSGFQGALGAAGAGLASELAALRQQYGTQEQQNALELLRHGYQGQQLGLQQLQLGLEPQFENYYQAGNAGAGPQLLSAGLGAAGQYFGARALGDQIGNYSGNSGPLNNNQLSQLLLLLGRR